LFSGGSRSIKSPGELLSAQTLRPHLLQPEKGSMIDRYPVRLTFFLRKSFQRKSQTRIPQGTFHKNKVLCFLSNACFFPFLNLLAKNWCSVIEKKQIITLKFDS
jgi:hypothetical protein